MIELNVPGGKTLRLSHAVFDLNGTLAVDGRVPPVVAKALRELAARIGVLIASADTNGTLSRTGAELGVAVRRVADGDDKARFLAELRGSGATGVVAVGNGRNDVPMLRTADLSIVVMGREGASGAAIATADLVVASAEDALDLLGTPARLVSGLRP